MQVVIQADPCKKKEVNTENKKYTQLFSLITLLGADWHLSKHCRLTIVS